MTYLIEAFQSAKLIQIVENACLKNCVDTLVADIEAEGVKFLNALYVSQMANFISASMGQEVLFGFIGIDRNQNLIVVFRCTETLLEVAHDVLFLPSPNYMKGAEFTLVATGFLRMYQSLKYSTRSGGEFSKDVVSKIASYKPDRVMISGHSLGASLATLLGFELALTKNIAPTVYTFGSPRVGDFLFAKKYNELVPDSLRVAMAYDPITAVPIFPSYWHVNTVYVLHPVQKLTKTDLLAHHHISTYRWAMSLVIPGVDIIPLDPKLLPKASIWDKIKEKVTSWWRGK